MSDLLLIQSIGDNDRDTFAKYMELEEPIHREYAAACGADYEYFVGWSDPRVNPTWNRIAMMLDGFQRGYRKIVWLDADTLVVDPTQDIFAGTSNDVPLLMTRVMHAHVDMPWGPFDQDTRRARRCGSLHKYEGRICQVPLDQPVKGHAGDHGDKDGPWPQWDVYNDGVLIVNDSHHARECLSWAWDKRRAPFEPWHVPGMPELCWLLDYVYKYPEAVEQLDGRWNCMGYDHECSRDEAAILAWHGIPHAVRFDQFKLAYDERWGE